MLTVRDKFPEWRLKAVVSVEGWNVASQVLN